MIHQRFHIHGDNIVECERVFSLIKNAHVQEYSCSGLSGSPTAPRFALRSSTEILEFIFFPGFGRWEQDILRYVTATPGTLREAADVIVTRVDANTEVPLAAIEYCSALAAGNNAWQRCGRAYSFAKAGIPYFYLTDIGGYELDADRGLKARRYPNVAVPFSYVTLSLRSNTIALPVYECNPSADSAFRNYFAPALGDSLLGHILFALLHRKPSRDKEKLLEEKAIRFIQLLQGRPDLRQESRDDFDAAKAYVALQQGNSLRTFLTTSSTPWRKSITIPLTSTAANFLRLGSVFGRGITKASLPVTFIPRQNRAAWAQAVCLVYPDLSKDISSWLARNEDLVLCWVAGFKPRGDDSRPDRGLVPLARMLFGDDIDLLSFIYGPGKPEMWRLLHSDAISLMKKNGLWEAVLTLSNSILLDSLTNKNLTSRGYTADHWTKSFKKQLPVVSFSSDNPVSYSEHDVDTALHNVMCHLMSDVCFEGMCNPPGGDWSGVSFLGVDRKAEYRWLTLPRVSGPNTKRPDHVFQLFPPKDAPFLLTIESKESPESVEEGIGPRLARYLNRLFSTPPNVTRAFPTGQWGPHSGNIPLPSFTIATGTAFLSADRQRISSSLQRSESDISLALSFLSGGKFCEIRGIASTALGRRILEIIGASLKVNNHAYRFIRI